MVGASRSGAAGRRRIRAGPGRVSLEHTHIYRVLTEAGEWLARVSGRLRHHAASRAEFPAVGDWVGVEPPQDDGFARIRDGAAAGEPVLAPRRGRPHRGAGRRRQHRHRLSRRRARRRLQPAPHRALPPRRCGQRRHAGHRAEQGGPGGRSRARSSTRCGASRPASRFTPCPATSPASLEAAARRARDPAGPGRCSDRPAWGSRTIVNRLGRPRPAGDPRRAHLGQPRPAHQHEPADGHAARATAS